MKAAALSMSSMATFSRRDTHFEQTEADPTSINIRDETCHRRYITFAYTLAMDKSKSVRPDAEVAFKIPGLSRVEWINAHRKAWPLPILCCICTLGSAAIRKAVPQMRS
jgi:hypothetical protein